MGRHVHPGVLRVEPLTCLVCVLLQPPRFLVIALVLLVCSGIPSQVNGAYGIGLGSLS